MPFPVAKLTIFGVISAGLVAVSWTSLRNWRSHGFFRFFAWEAILALILLNVDYWFDHPFSSLQGISWLMLVASLFLVIHGVWLLRVIRKPQGQIENTYVLVTVGAYKYIRHPLYASLLWLAWGVFFKNPSLLGVILAITASLFLMVTAKVEEGENIRKFGAEYTAYMKRTRMFIPFLLCR